MKELNMKEVEMVNGGRISAGEGASMILALGAMGGPATFAFALPVAGALYYLAR